MQIAAEHAEAVGERARVGVEERLLLDRIALHAADVAPRHAQRSALVEAHLADADRAFGQRTAVAAGVALQAPVIEHPVELAFASFSREHLSQRRHEDSIVGSRSAATWNLQASAIRSRADLQEADADGSEQLKLADR